MATFHLVSLGCPKNLVDSEVMLGFLQEAGWQLTEDPNDATVLLVNTCGFIQAAVEEAVDEILELAKIKEHDPRKYLVVTGCLVQRYGDKLALELPEVDLFVGTEGVPDIANLIQDLLSGSLVEKVNCPARFLMDSSMPRVISTPFFRSFLKITEGCNNRCSYCMIPSIRGSLRSRPVADLCQELRHLEQDGMKEISLIAQDLTAYGRDLGSEVTLPVLLRQLLAQTDVPWIRLMYLYPSGVTDELLELIQREARILPYIDIPFQHVSDSILKRMNRHYGQRDLCRFVDRVREVVPDIALRTTMMVGFPGETEDDLHQLESFLKKYQIDHVGLFAYTNEQGAASENFEDQCTDELKQDRLQRVMELQADISKNILQKYVGQVLPVLVEGLSRETDLLLEGRTVYQAPDIDGCVYITDGIANPGDIVQVRITEAQIYDLVGEIVEG
ncbi:MAG: 30S ribosomal protein S12 methylthiotransferase RimO [Proteobacteria bacterium]|nr:30S ribosomal protein S12 methylthiotransferase RimO [Pseudomonadota bacterium]MBU1231673.1 30S ribosomal protein S12 methylthiotransferase RimO [Pseudomonadota bacterium]MBU1417683.1 30S ribosomal protein S12 methylthiotransferase RimO [Pseudomonadota bacterium]MBU1456132.1 30S ribosomal protein S12 methylthiotransferase RimO [Pseudomonadota bacterium]